MVLPSFLGNPQAPGPLAVLHRATGHGSAPPPRCVSRLGCRPTTPDASVKDLTSGRQWKYGDFIVILMGFNGV